MVRQCMKGLAREVTSRLSVTIPRNVRGWPFWAEIHQLDKRSSNVKCNVADVFCMLMRKINARSILATTACKAANQNLIA